MEYNGLSLMIPLEIWFTLRTHILELYASLHEMTQDFTIQLKLIIWESGYLIIVACIVDL